MKRWILFSILSFGFLAFAEEELRLPELTTYVPADVEQKIVVTAEDIEKAHYESLSEVVEHCGIQNLAYGPYGLDSKPSIRGFTDETVRVVIDGVCVNNAQYGTFDFSSINISSIEQIEIVRGGFTEGVEDEGSVGGVIYITTKKGALKNSFESSTAFKTYFNRDMPLDSVFQTADFNLRLGDNSFLRGNGSLNLAENAYFYKFRNEPVCVQKNAQVFDGSGNLSFVQYFGSGNSFTIGDLFYGGKKHVPGPATSHGVNPGLQQDYDNMLSFELWNPSVASLFNLKNNVSWLCNNRFYKDKAGTENSEHYVNTIKYSGTADFTSLAGGRLQQLVGLSGDFTNLDSTNDGKHIQFSGVFKETTKIAVGAGWSFSVPLAVKFCENDDKLNFAFVPKLGTAWEIGYFKIFADAYRMVQFPNMDDLFWEGGGFRGNPDLKPEKGWGADLGFSFNGVKAGPNSFRGGLTVFSNYYEEKIRWVGGTTKNLSSAFYLGVDFSAGADFFNGLLTLDVNGEYLYNRLLDKSDKLTYGNRIMWTPDLVCSAAIGLNLEFAKFTLSGSYTSYRYTDNLNVYLLKPYLLLDFAAEAKEIGGHFSPFVKLANMLNWQYQAVDTYPMPGISLTAGARIKFD